MTLADIFLLAVLVLTIIFGYYLIIGWMYRTPFYPSSPKPLKEIINKYIKNPSKKNFIDLGSGDGRIVIWAKRNNFRSATGVEINPFLSILSKIKISLYRLSKNTKILQTDFNNIEFTNYDVVYMYIFSEHMEKVKTKLFKELKPGSIIISKVFKFKDQEIKESIGQYHIYVVGEH